MSEIIFGLDVGTTKICALVGEVTNRQLRIIGVGMEEARGIKRGVVVDVPEATIAIAKAIEQAEKTSGYDLAQAVVTISGEHVKSTNNRGVVGVGRNDDPITREDVERVLAAAQDIQLPRNQQIIHLIPRQFTVDEQHGIVNPVGMRGFRLEVEAHIVTADQPALLNLAQCVGNVGINADEYVLNALAAGEAVLEPNEREMGVIVADIGGGTTDLALYMQGQVWHTKTLTIGGYHISNDIAIGLRAPFEVAEQVKIQYGDCRPAQIDPDYTFAVEPFGGEKINVGRQDLAHVIEARVEEIFQLILEEIKRSGYGGLLPAGIVLTGGTAQLRGITAVAERVLNVPARVAGPKKIVGLVEALDSPAYASSVGLLRWAMADHYTYRPRDNKAMWGRRMGGFLKALLPG
jgi:cell division protein FtsA